MRAADQASLAAEEHGAVERLILELRREAGMVPSRVRAQKLLDRLQDWIVRIWLRTWLVMARVRATLAPSHQTDSNETARVRSRLAASTEGRDWETAERVLHEVRRNRAVNSAYLWNWLAIQVSPHNKRRRLRYARRSYARKPWPDLADKIVRLAIEARQQGPLPDQAVLDLAADDPSVAMQQLRSSPPMEAGEAALTWLLLGDGLSSDDPRTARDCYREALRLHPTARAAKRLAQVARQMGNLSEAAQARYRYLQLSGPDATDSEVLAWAKARSANRLLQHGYDVSSRGPKPPTGRGLLYCLHNSLPQASGGYATRSHNLTRALLRTGVPVTCCTRFGFPWDNPRYWQGDEPPEITRAVEVDGVDYRRLPTVHVKWGKLPREQYLELSAEGFRRVAEDVHPETIQAASNWINGMGALEAARRYGVPFIYEVRGLWEVTKGSRDPDWVGSEDHRLQEQMEAQCALEADAVIAITHALKQELGRRGVPLDRIAVVPNSVDVEVLQPQPADTALRRELGLDDTAVVVGYVGSLVDYEGLDDLLRALQLVLEAGVDVSALIVGDGDAREGLERLSEQLGIGDRVIFTGRVPHDAVGAYYSLIDIAPLPRKPLPVTEMVSPLKPYEAMALEKVVVASDVAALAEMVQPEETGLLFEKGSVDGLAAQLTRVATDADLRMGIGRTARKWVEENRTWGHAAQAMNEIRKGVLTGSLRDAVA